MIPKFRAWDKNKKWMVYDVQDAYDGLWSERNSDEINDYYGYVSTFQSFTDEESFNFMQSTGLEDKNGVEIYEGDIVHISIEEEYQTINMLDIVVFENGSFTTQSFGYDFYNNGGDLLTVKGNIYEHPELLEVSND